MVFGSGAGRPLVLVHGFPLDHTMWAGQIESLASQCRVIAADLPGFGRSAPAGTTATMEQFADKLAALLDGLGISEPAVVLRAVDGRIRRVAVLAEPLAWILKPHISAGFYSRQIPPVQR